MSVDSDANINPTSIAHELARMSFALRCDGSLETLLPSLLPALCKTILVSAIGMNTLNTIHSWPAPVSISRLLDHLSSVERIANAHLLPMSTSG